MLQFCVPAPHLHFSLGAEWCRSVLCPGSLSGSPGMIVMLSRFGVTNAVVAAKTATFLVLANRIFCEAQVTQAS